MSISRRHHFIPKYYLNNFTNNDNKFFVFDKKYPNKIVSRSPKQVCYENHRNSLFGKSNIPDPYLEEKVYGSLDNKHAKVFYEYCNEVFDLKYWSEERAKVLEFFVPLLFWRNPTNDELFDEIINSMSSLHDLDLTISSEVDGNEIDDQEFHKEILSNPDFKKVARVNYAVTTFRHNIHKYKELEWRVYDCLGFGGFVTSDNPLLFRCKMEEIADLRGDVIFPISPTRSFLRIDEKRKNTFPVPAIQNFHLIHSAQRFVISPDKDYLELLISEYSRFLKAGKLDDLLKNLWLF